MQIAMPGGKRLNVPSAFIGGGVAAVITSLVVALLMLTVFSDPSEEELVVRALVDAMAGDQKTSQEAYQEFKQRESPYVAPSSRAAAKETAPVVGKSGQQAPRPGSKAAVLGGLEGTHFPLSILDVTAHSNASKTAVDTVRFTLATSTGVDLSADSVIVTYLDNDQAMNCKHRKSYDNDPNPTSECSWSRGGSGYVLPGEQVDMIVDLTALAPQLGKNKRFTIQVKPDRGAVVIIDRTTPVNLEPTMSLN